jgi:hypothetical protein
MKYFTNAPSYCIMENVDLKRINYGKGVYYE